MSPISALVLATLLAGTCLVHAVQLQVVSWNVQTFGQSFVSDPAQVDAMQRVVRRYDMAFIQEVILCVDRTRCVSTVQAVAWRCHMLLPCVVCVDSRCGQHCDILYAGHDQREPARQRPV